MKKEEMFEVFSEEAKQRWGETQEYKESARRTARYGKREWEQIKAEGEEIHQGLAQAMSAGVKPTEARAMDLAEKHRRHIDRWFYPCAHSMHRGLGDMYVADERFTQTYDRVKPGLAAYLREAIHANGDRAG